jgi:hypothetical protein
MMVSTLIYLLKLPLCVGALLTKQQEILNGSTLPAHQLSEKINGITNHKPGCHSNACSHHGESQKQHVFIDLDIAKILNKPDDTGYTTQHNQKD